MVKGFPSYSRPHAHVKVLGVIITDFGHLLQVDTNATIEGTDASFEACAGTMRDDWNVVFIADLANLRKRRYFLILSVT